MQQMPNLRLLALVAMLWLAVQASSAVEPLAVHVTSPQMNADIGVGPTIALAAEVISPDGAIAKVEFFDDDQLIGTITQAPFTFDYRPTAHKLNYRITANATDAAGHTAISPSVTCVATSKVQRKYKILYYKETDEVLLRERLDKNGRPMEKNFELEIPEDVATVRGILVSTTGVFNEAWFREFMHMHDFAFLRGSIFSHVEDFKSMQNALKQFAKEVNHPELVNVPYVATGYSAGGGFCLRLVTEVPERVISIVPVCCYLPKEPGPAQMQIPSCAIPGDLPGEKIYGQQIEPVIAEYRPKGALFGWMTVQDGSHGRYGQEVLAMPMLDAATRLRYPPDGDVRKGPVTLKPVDLASGWVADNSTWKSGLTSIAPEEEFKGDVKKSSWLLDKDIAFIYRAYATYDRPLTISSPLNSWSRDRSWDPGSNVTIVVDDTKFPGWKKLEFYDGAKKIGEITQGPPQFTALNLATGYHAFSVLGTDAQENVRPSNPVLVVVRKLPALQTTIAGK